MSKKQMRELQKEVRTWYATNGELDKYKTATVTEVVHEYIRPRTAGKGVSWSLMRNVRNLKSRLAKTLVSHVWNEGFEEFFHNLIECKFLAEDDQVWICFLAIFQHIDGDMSGPSITEYLGPQVEHGPFVQVLQHEKVQRLLVNQTSAKSAQVMLRLWCLWEMFLAMQRKKDDSAF